MIRWATTFVLTAVLVWGSPTHAGTIVFDFEDGLQGWTLTGAVQRVQTQVLGGEWAIFGDGFIPGGENLPIMRFAPSSIGVPFEDVVSVTFDSLVIEAAGGFSEPRVRHVLDLVVQPADVLVTVFWSSGIVRLPLPPPEDIGATVAFIDNITFHTIPEPSVLMLLALGGLLLGTSGWLTRRRLGYSRSG